jgi:cytochrome c553
MLESDGKIVQINGEPVCLVCHEVKPNPEVDRTKDVKFKADVAFLCWRCHGIMANVMFLDSHFQTEPSATMIDYIRKEEEELAVTIPMVPRQRITCSTCHNPHQKGVIVYLPSARGADSKYRLRLPRQTLCFACHEV